MHESIAVLTITVLAVLSPGPDFAMVSRNSLLLSRRAGVLTALGIGLGVWVHVAYTLLGVGLVIQQSLRLYAALKIVGALYLLYLGVKMLRSREPAAAEAQAPVAAMSDWAALRTGFLTNALNPKCTVFVVSLFLQVVQPATPMAQRIGYGAFVSATHIVWFALVALLFSHGSVRAALLRWRLWIDRAFGALLVGFGALLAGSALRR
ncbi:LysE family transporter [Pseudomonas sp. CGJS7]|uniref:LysE family transporter n=1 Tax=Pseudomonas sp. CGJS7 TaxID=3109348 RepID=UPI00300A50B0